jgi:TPP-dependent trihydroxycyclohexane-1,2-dione (THcHDO) dehydratase
MAMRVAGEQQQRGRRAKVTAMRAMMTVTGVVCDKEARARVMPKAMRVVRNEEGEGSKAMATATRVAGERWQWQQGWWARKRVRLARQQRDGDEMTTRRR